ncbi:hypothetical protein [Bartonella sp. AU55XJBT]|uniref:hypothetical protein n=1 Tax=Bartonella sp. AU55XJBT TaxID=3019091 RepID=UPI0023604B6C|nr:hypothetical protein [Bartonella sp. AU55XJBT]
MLPAVCFISVSHLLKRKYRCTIAPFNIDPGEEKKWDIFILPQNLDKPASPLFILEHTSSNHPERVVQTKFWTEFLLAFEDENSQE